MPNCDCTHPPNMKHEVLSVSGNTVVVSGDFVCAQAFIGVPYEFRYRFSHQYLDAPAGRDGEVIRHEGRHQIRGWSLILDEAEVFDVEVLHKGNSSPYVYNYVIEDVPWADTQFEFPVMSLNDRVKVDLVSTDPRPCRFLSAAYYASFAPRAQRVR